MFQQLVTALSFSPSSASQLTYYLRRLQKESITRHLSVVAVAFMMIFQIAAFIAPPTASNAQSPFDIVLGGFNDKNDLLNIYSHGDGTHSGEELRTIFNHFGIYSEQIEAAKMGQINSGDHSIFTLGRLNHFGPDTIITINGVKYYQHALYHWQDNHKFPALIGKNKDGEWFAIMKECGNVAIKRTKTPTPTPSPTPNIVVSKAARNITTAANANGKVARAGDTIQYTLTTQNTGKGIAAGFQVEEDLRDVLEYATLTKPNGGTLAKGILIWPKANIAAGAKLVKTFEVRVKSPIPATPRSASDPLSFDLRMDNVYGNVVQVLLPSPTVKTIETTITALPQTGPGESLVITLALASLIVFFYLRNRQLVTELKILRGDHHGATS